MNRLIVFGAILLAQYGVPPVPQYGYTGKVTPNAYGSGVNADQYGRPHQYKDRETNQPLPGYQQPNVRRNAYGQGVHADQYGRPVYDGNPQ